ncbi:MAG: hypothetical protein R6X34_20835 [Chloroflexota bacterium]
MMRLKGSSGKNPLVARVQRYTTMSAIFRSPETTALLIQSGDQSQSPVVNTFIIPPSFMPEMPEMTAWPAAAARQESPVETQSAPVVSPAAAQDAAQPVSSTTPAVHPASGIQPTAIQRSAVPAPVYPTAVSSPASLSKPSQANSWSRFKSAVRRVQNAVSGRAEQVENDPVAEMETETITAVSPAPASPIQREPAAPPAGLMQPVSQIPPLTLIPLQESAPSSQAAPAPPANPPANQRDTPAGDQPASEPPGATTDPITRRLDQIMRLHREKGTIETPPDTLPTSPETAVSPAPINPPPMQRDVSETPPPSAETDPVSRRLDQIMRQHRAKGDIEPPPGTEAEAPPPIQASSAAPPPPAKTTTSSQPDLVEAETAVYPESTGLVKPDNTDQTVNAIPEAETQAIPLQSVWPVQIIESPTPPAARPVSAPTGPLMRQTAPQETSKAIRQLDSVPPGQPTTSSVQYIQPRKPRPQPLQRKQAPEYSQTDVKAAARSSDFSTPSDTVATEIGDLPGDLWRLIGAKPPTAPPGQRSPAVSEVTEREPAQTTAVTQAKTTPPTIIQRVESEQPPVADLSPTTEAPPSPESEQDEAGQNEEIDINELARQVYGEIKDRMTIEWERTRGRF